MRGQPPSWGRGRRRARNRGASARGHLGKQVITDDGRRDAACTAD